MKKVIIATLCFIGTIVSIIWILGDIFVPVGQYTFNHANNDW